MEILSYKHTADYSKAGIAPSEVIRLKVADNGRSLAGYGSVYDIVDYYNEYLEIGAYEDFVSRKEYHPFRERLRLVKGHDMNEPIARIKDLKSDNYGLWFEAEIDKRVAEVTYIKDMLMLLDAGVVDELSAGVLTRDENLSWDNERRALKIRKAALKEMSVVTLGANPLAVLETIKTKAATGQSDALEVARRLEVAMNKNITDKSGKAIEQTIALLKSINQQATSTNQILQKWTKN